MWQARRMMPFIAGENGANAFNIFNINTSLGVVV